MGQKVWVASYHFNDRHGGCDSDIKRIDNEDGYKTHVVIGSTSDNKMFRTEFHTSGNSGVKLPDYYKDYQSTLSKDRHLLVKNICNFIVYVQHHMKKRGWEDFKTITITDMDTIKKIDVYANFAYSRSNFFESVHEHLPRKFRPKVFECSVEDTDTWFQVCIY